VVSAPTEKVRVPLAQAEAVAEAALALLAPACERVEVAGSIRRRKADVGDVELVAVPKLEPVTDLFGAVTGQRDLLHERCAALLAEGVFAHRLGVDGKRSFGPKSKRLRFTHDGAPFPLDLFVVTPPAQWGAVFTIRTGPGDFSKRLVTSRLQYPGYGLMPAGMREHEGSLWDGGRPVPTPEEGDFFAALGLAWLPPELRTDDAVLVRRGGPGR
jgi:DNA polymerase (family 10)